MRVLQCKIPNAEVKIVWGLSNTDLERISATIPNLNEDLSRTLGFKTKFDNKDLYTAFYWALSRVLAFDSEVCQRLMIALSKREYLGSTGVGNGVAAPHTYAVSCAPEIKVVWLHLFDFRLDFSTLDGVPCNTFAIQISPPDQRGNHLRTLEYSSCILRKGFKTLPEFLAAMQASSEINPGFNEYSPLQVEALLSIPESGGQQ